MFSQKLDTSRRKIDRVACQGPRAETRGAAGVRSSWRWVQGEGRRVFLSQFVNKRHRTCANGSNSQRAKGPKGQSMRKLTCLQHGGRWSWLQKICKTRHRFAALQDRAALWFGSPWRGRHRAWPGCSSHQKSGIASSWGHVWVPPKAW